MPARFASQSRNSQHPPKHRHHPLHVLRGDSLQFQIAANLAMRMKVMAHRHGWCVKPRFAPSAPPRQDARKSKKMIQRRPAFRPPRLRPTTIGAD